MFILDPESSNYESSCDEFDQYLKESNLKDNSDEESEETNAKLCGITNLYFGPYTLENYHKHKLTIDDSRLLQSILSNNVTDPSDVFKKKV